MSNTKIENAVAYGMKVVCDAMNLSLPDSWIKATAKEYQNSIIPENPTRYFLDTTIEEIDMSKRLYRVMRENGVNILRDLVGQRLFGFTTHWEGYGRKSEIELEGIIEDAPLIIDYNGIILIKN